MYGCELSAYRRPLTVIWLYTYPLVGGTCTSVTQKYARFFVVICGLRTLDFFFGMVENRCVYGSRLFFYFCEIIKSCLFGHPPRMTCRPKLDQLDKAFINLFFFARSLALYQHHIRTVRARGNEQDRTGRKEGKKEVESEALV